MPDDFPYDVFLSHSAKDKAVVRPPAERSRQGGFKVWLDEWVLLVAALCRAAATLGRSGKHWSGPNPHFSRQHSAFSLSSPPPSQTPWRNSFRSAAARRTASKGKRSLLKPPAKRDNLVKPNECSGVPIQV